MQQGQMQLQQGQMLQESHMSMKPKFMAEWYKGTGKLQGKVALITGGDSGIGRSVAILYAREGCHVALSYLAEHQDANDTLKLVEKEGAKCLLLAGDIRDPNHCRQLVDKTMHELGKIDILVHNAGTQAMHKNLTDISDANIRDTFETNLFSHMTLTRHALPHLKEGSSILFNTSVAAFTGHPELLDYAATKGAMTSFMRALASNLANKGIRVNAVAPGPIITPLIESSYPKEEAAKFGKDTPLGRPGQPEEVAPAFVFLASHDGSYMTGQTLHVNGGLPTAS